MKALGLIVLCVVMLAVLQASYLLVEGKKPGEKPHLHYEDHTHDENDVSAPQNIRDDIMLPRHNKHHHHEHKHNKDGEPNSERKKEQLSHALGSPITGNGHKDRKHPNQVSNDLFDGPAALDDKAAFDKDNLDPNGILAEDIPIPKVDQPTTENNVTERIDPAATIVKEPDTLPLYDQMMGDGPVQDMRTNSKKKAGDRKDRKKGKHHKKEKKSRQMCDSDADCGEGSCCLQKKKGGKVCKTGGFKDLGKRCSSSCVCKTGLQCYVTSINKRGKKRHPHSEKVIMGRCVDPDVEQKPGYFMTSPPLVNTEILPARTGADI